MFCESISRRKVGKKAGGGVGRRGKIKKERAKERKPIQGCKFISAINTVSIT